MVQSPAYYSVTKNIPHIVHRTFCGVSCDMSLFSLNSEIAQNMLSECIYHVAWIYGLRKKNPNGIHNTVHENCNVMGWHFTDQLRILWTPVLVFWEFARPVPWNKALSLPEWLQNQFLQYISCEGTTSKKFSQASWSVLYSLWTSCLIRTQMWLCCISCWWYRYTCLLCKTSRQCV
jgi:hypothetical protein